MRGTGGQYSSIKIAEDYYGHGKKARNNFKIENIMLSDERIQWRGVPNEECYIKSHFYVFLPFVIGWWIISLVFYLLAKYTFFSQFEDLIIGVLTLMLILWCLVPVVMFVYKLINKKLELRNTEYVVTNRRILIKHGIFYVKVISIYYEEVDFVKVKYGIGDKKYDVSNVVIGFLDYHKCSFVDIKNGEEIAKLIEEYSNNK